MCQRVRRREILKMGQAGQGDRLPWVGVEEVLPPPCLSFLPPQLAGLFSCTVVLSVLLWLGPFFYYLPKVGRGREAPCA